MGHSGPPRLGYVLCWPTFPSLAPLESNASWVAITMVSFSTFRTYVRLSLNAHALLPSAYILLKYNRHVKILTSTLFKTYNELKPKSLNVWTKYYKIWKGLFFSSAKKVFYLYNGWSIKLSYPFLILTYEDWFLLPSTLIFDIQISKIRFTHINSILKKSPTPI